MTDFSSGFFGNKSIGFGKSKAGNLKKRSYVSLLAGKKVENDPFVTTLIVATSAYNTQWKMDTDPPKQFIDMSGQIPADVLEKPINELDLPNGFGVGMLFSIFMNDESIGPLAPRKVLCAPVFFDYPSTDNNQRIYYYLPGIILPLVGVLPVKVGEGESSKILQCHMLLGN